MDTLHIVILVILVILVIILVYYMLNKRNNGLDFDPYHRKQCNIEEDDDSGTVPPPEPEPECCENVTLLLDNFRNTPTGDFCEIRTNGGDSFNVASGIDFLWDATGDPVAGFIVEWGNFGEEGQFFNRRLAVVTQAEYDINGGLVTLDGLEATCQFDPSPISITPICGWTETPASLTNSEGGLEVTWTAVPDADFYVVHFFGDEFYESAFSTLSFDFQSAYGEVVAAPTLSTTFTPFDYSAGDEHEQNGYSQPRVFAYTTECVLPALESTIDIISFG